MKEQIDSLVSHLKECTKKDGYNFAKEVEAVITGLLDRERIYRDALEKITEVGCISGYAHWVRKLQAIATQALNRGKVDETKNAILENHSRTNTTV